VLAWLSRHPPSLPLGVGIGIRKPAASM
jgi:hypothetical protein